MPTLEKMSHLPVSLVPAPRVTEEKILHDFEQRDWTDFDQVVDVIAHQNIGIQAKVKPQSGFLKQLQISPSVGVIRNASLALIAPADHMIKRAWTIRSRFSCHARSCDVRRESPRGNKACLTLTSDPDLISTIRPNTRVLLCGRSDTWL